MVLTPMPSMPDIETTQERIALPFLSILQAPHPFLTFFCQASSRGNRMSGMPGPEETCGRSSSTDVSAPGGTDM